jgi:hypothetical protein
MDARWKRLSFAGALRSGHWILAFPINIGGPFVFIEYRDRESAVPADAERN